MLLFLVLQDLLDNLVEHYALHVLLFSLQGDRGHLRIDSSHENALVVFEPGVKGNKEHLEVELLLVFYHGLFLVESLEDLALDLYLCVLIVESLDDGAYVVEVREVDPQLLDYFVTSEEFLVQQLDPYYQVLGSLILWHYCLGVYYHFKVEVCLF